MNSHRNQANAALILFLLLGLPSPIPSPAQTVQTAQPAQTTQATQNPSFKLQLNVRQVLLDVVVLDKNGAPVPGLKSTDFTILEDGKPQTIREFEWFDGTAPSGGAVKLPKLPPGTFTNLTPIPEQGPLYVLYYDMVNTHEEDQMALRRELLQFIDDAPEGTRMAIFVNARKLHLVQGFTTNRQELKSALDSKNGRGLVPAVFIYPEIYGRDDAGAPLYNLTQIARFLEGIPGRKNLLWLSGSFPIPVAPSVQPGGATGLAGSPAPMHSAQGGPQVLDLTGLMKDAVQSTYSALMRAQVAVYTIDVRGVLLKEGGAAALVAYDRMNTIAQATGGHAYYSNNRVRLLLNQAVHHGETYYTLSYAPANQDYKGDLRNIKVELHRKGEFHLSYRTVYCAVPDDAPARRTGQAAVSTASIQDAFLANLRHGMPAVRDLLFAAHISPTRQPHTATPAEISALTEATGQPAPEASRSPRLQKYVFDYNLLDPRLRKSVSQGRKQVLLDFAAAAYSEDGVLLNLVTNRGLVTANDHATAGAFHALQELQVPEETRFLRLVVRDATTHRTGTLEVRVPLKQEATTQTSMNIPQ